MGRIAVFFIASTACLARFVNGTVGDTHGSPIPDVTVTISAQNFVAQTTTDADGNYRVEAPTGPATITFEAQGFNKVTSSADQTADEAFLTVMMHPAPKNENEIVIFTIAATASGRPQYLPGSGLWPGMPIVLNGLFGAKQPVRAAADGPPPLELDGYSITWGAGGNLVLGPITYVSANQITALVPIELTDGRWNVTVNKGEQPTRGGLVAVGQRFFFKPWTYTRNGLGYGTAEATNEAGDDITLTNPARPGGVADIKIVTPNGANEFHGNFYFGDGVPLTIKPNGAALGTSIAQLKIPENITTAQTSCAVPFRISGTNKDGRTVFGNAVTLPVSLSGPCSDALGFGAGDFARLSSAGGIKLLDNLITEGTFLTTIRTDRVFGRMTARQWSNTAYPGVQPVDTCTYGWEPFQFGNPNGAAVLPLGGAASITVPWGLFSLSPTSNAGPYSLQFSNPPTFTEGNYSLVVPFGFTVGGGAHRFETSGAYQRPAGRVRDFVAGRAAQEGFWSGLGLLPYLEEANLAIKAAPAADLARVYADFNIIADNGTMGRHFVRCVMDPTNPSFGNYTGPSTNKLFTDLIPERTNTTTVTIRILPRDQIRHEHTNSGADRSLVTFDAFVAAQVNGNR
jgi:uncharacterized protein (TIGR03437 family)